MNTEWELLRQPKAVSIDELLRSYILRAQLAPGDPLPTEPVLCQMLGCSRNRLREAIQRLQALDVLDVRHGVGTFVGRLSLRPLADVLQFSALVKARVDRKAVRDILDVRIAVDRGMAPTICDRISQDDADELLALCAEMNSLAEQGRMLSVVDRRFHLRLAELAGNDLAGELVVAFWDVMEHIEIDLARQPQDEIVRTAQSHLLMTQCALASDLAGYYEALDMHYESAVRRIGAYVAEQRSDPAAPDSVS